MTPLGKLIRRTTERALGRYYEGPEPPKRLRQVAEEFVATHPKATRSEWLEMAVSLAEAAYKEAYDRGLGWADRDLDRRDPVDDPEALAEIEAHDWDWTGGAPTSDETADQSVEGDLRYVQPDERGMMPPEDEDDGRGAEGSGTR